MLKNKVSLVALAVMAASVITGCSSSSFSSKTEAPAQQMRSIFDGYSASKNNIDTSTYGIITDQMASAVQNLDAQYLNKINAIDRSELSTADKIYYDIFVFERKISLQGAVFPNTRFGSFTMPLSHFNNVFADNAQEIGATKASLEEYKKNLTDIKQYSSWVRGVSAQFALGEAQGIELPKILVRRFIESLDSNFSKDDFQILKAGLKDLQSKPLLYPKEFVKSYADAINQSEQALTIFMTFLQTKALNSARGEGTESDNNIGWGALANGQAWYKWHLDRNSTTGKSADELHQIGLDFVSDAKSEMIRVAKFVAEQRTLPIDAMYKGANDSKAKLRSFNWIDKNNADKVDLVEFFAYLNSEKFFYGRDGQTNPGDLYKENCKQASHVAACQFALKDYNKFKVDANKVVKGYFNPIKSEYQIVPTPKADEAYAGVASNEGKLFILNTHPGLSLQKWNISTLLLHEATPGHHFQYAYALEYPPVDKPQYLQDINYTAYEEGWALYTEWLGIPMRIYGELNKDGKPTFKNATGMCTDVQDFAHFQGGIYSNTAECNALQYFGSLNEAQLRNMRLVVDTGIHAKGWSIKEVKQYLHANSALGTGDINSESYRYAAYVGQAVSYKSGFIVIHALLLKAQAELGDAFKWADFHDQILKYGAQPMQVLEESINSWITAQSKK